MRSGLSHHGARIAAVAVAVLAVGAWWLGAATDDPGGAADDEAAATGRDFYLDQQSPILTKASATGTSVVSWGFAGGAPEEWLIYQGARVRPGTRGTLVRSSTGRSEYQLGSGPTKFEPGSYTVLVAGEVIAGGLQLGVLDVNRNRWLGNSFYWRGQRVQTGLMATAFTLTRPTLVSVVLANWAPTRTSSRWLIENVVVKPGNQVPAGDITVRQQLGPRFGKASFDPVGLEEPLPSSLKPYLGQARAISEGPGTVWERAARIRELVRGALPSSDSCGTLAMGFWSLGSLVGLPLRLVIGTMNAQNLYDTHTTVEVWLEDEQRWAISDPTFNGYWTQGPDGPPLGVAEVSEAVAAGRQSSIHWHAAHTRNSILPSSYYLDPLLLYRYYAIQGFVGEVQAYLTKDPTYVRAWGGFSGTYQVSRTLDLGVIAPDRNIEARRIDAKRLEEGAPADFTMPPPYAAELLHDGVVEVDARGQAVLELDHYGSVVVVIDSAEPWKLVNRDAEYDFAPLDGLRLSPVVVVDSRRLGFRADPDETAETRVRVWSVSPFPLTREH